MKGESNVNRINWMRLGVALSGLWLLAAPARGEKPAWEDRPLPAWKPTVPASAASVDGPAQIRWAPEEYRFVAGDSARYIDFDAGDDARSGLSPDQAWKHHPWDARAQANAATSKGAHTYVFKRGAVYRGALVGKESGTEGAPIRLVSDPAWGQGEATIAGSQAIAGGWTKVSAESAAKAGFPPESRDRLWSVKLDGDFIPRALWLMDAAGNPTRLPLARWPNWRAEHPYNIYTQWFRVEKIDKGFPYTRIFAPKVLNDPDPHAFDHATIWVDHANTSGEFSIIGPFPSGVKGYNPSNGSLQVELTHPVRHPVVNSPFFLENLPRFLDEAGEWYFGAAGDEAGALYVRLPDDADPNAARIEAAREVVILDIIGQRHIEVAGLSFMGGNCPDLNASPDVGGYRKPNNNTQSAAIRLVGDCRDVTLRNLHLHDTAGSGIVNFITGADDLVSGIRVTDNRIERIDTDGIALNRGLAWRNTDAQPKGRLTDVMILRNRIHDTGSRSTEPQGGRGIDVYGPEVAEIAGNVIDHTGAQGIDINGGRPMGGWMGRDAAETPLTRILVDRNQVAETLLRQSDFGGIEFWGTGPIYVYDNISYNPVGFVAHRNVYHKNQAFYFDHGYKGYLFNNIGWSDSRDDAYKGILAEKFFQQVRNRWTMAFQNTSWNFRNHYGHEGAYGDQQQYLGNLLMDAMSFHSFWRLDEATEIAYSHNVHGGKYELFYSRFKGDKYRSIDEMKAAIAGMKNQQATDVGWVSDDPLVKDAKAHDFRPTDTSAAIDRGVKAFVPWSLYGVVGEWNFLLRPDQPGTVLGYDLYPQRFYTGGEMFQMKGPMPGNDLVGEGIAAESYIPGVLENWAPGAIALDGKSRLTLANARLVKDIPYKYAKEDRVWPGKDRKTVRMEDNNFLIEAVLRVQPGAATGTVAGKMAPDAGYDLGLDAQGRLVMRLRAAGADASRTTATAVNDGRWHHIIAEVDRAAGTTTMYLDGVAANGPASGAVPAAGVSLDNDADFVVGEGLVGALDYLRVSRGTLADAKTTIDELMAWQFNGPALHDFAGRPAAGTARDAGAIENPTASGPLAIHYTPPAPLAESPPAPVKGDAAAGNDDFKEGPDRTVKAVAWGSVSAPKQVAVGEVVDVQVVFGTESIAKEQVLKVDLHGFVGPKRVGPIAHSAGLKVTPGVTKPYAVRLKVPKRDGLSAVAVVVVVSPDGGWENRTLSTEVGVKVVAAGAEAPKPKDEPKVPVKDDAPAKAPPKADAGAGAAPADDMQTREFDWATVTCPKSAKVGQKVTVEIKIKPEAIKQDVKLRVDTHWFEGKARKAGGPRSGLLPIKAGESKTFTVTLPIPDKPNISAVQYVIYVGPTGGWADRLYTSEVGVRVK